MDQFNALLNSILPSGIDWQGLLLTFAFLALGIMLLGFLARLLFGKGSLFNQSLCSAINILFIYLVTVLIHSFGIDLSFLISPLPFITLSGDYLHFFVDMTNLSSQLFSMVILGVLVNLADSWLPQGKGLVGWFFFRCISVLLAMLLHLITLEALEVILPAIILLWTPRVLLWGLMLMVLLSTLKVVFALTSPLLALLSSFFLGHIFGKMVCKAVLTTAILGVFVAVLNHFGVSAVYIAASALLAYVPILLVLILIWYLLGHKL